MIKNLIPQGEFAKNVLTLMTGTSIAQAIPIALTPILTRLYTPEQFGVYALYLAAASLLAVIATARYELAIMLPKAEEDAAALVVLSIAIAVVLSVVSFFLIYFLNDRISIFLGNREIGKWLCWTPLALLFTGIYQSLNYWSNRKKHFKRLAISRMVQGSGSAASQVGLGAAALPGGLIFGSLIGQFLATAAFFRLVWRDDKALLCKVDSTKIFANAKTFSKFPRFSIFGALVDNAALQTPVFMLNRFFNAHITGVFSLTLRVLGLPMTLLSTTLSQVLFQKVVAIQHEAPERLRSFILMLSFGLMGLMVPFVAGVWLFGEPLFSFLFGHRWAEAGAFAALLSIAVAMRFVVSPLSAVLAMEHNIRLGSLWQFIYFSTITTTLFLARKLEIHNFLKVYVAHEVVLYSLYFYFILKGSSNALDEVVAA